VGRRKPRTYHHAGHAGCVSIKRAQETGTHVGIYNAKQAGLDPEGGDWVVICEVHHTVLNCQTLQGARDMAPVPTEWCEWCHRPT